jgi:hypothetical protein
MSAITSQNAASAIVKLVAAQALPPLVGNLVMGNLVNRDFEPTLAANGDTVNIPIPPKLVANNIAEAGTVQPQNPSLGNAQIVINSHREATFTIPDVTKILAVPDLLKTYMEPGVIALAEQIDTDLLAQYPLFTQNAAVGGAASLTEAVLDSAETVLFTAKVPASASKWLVCSAAAYSELRQLPRFTEYQTIGPDVARALGMSPMVTGALPGAGGMQNSTGKLKDFFIFRSQFVPNVAGTYQNLAGSKDAIGLVMRRLPMPLPGTGAIAQYVELGGYGFRVVMSYQPNTLAQQFTIDCLYGVGVLRGNFGVVVNNN